MKVVQDGGLYKVAKITGPSHNFLALRLEKIQNSDCKIVNLSPEEKQGVSSEEALYAQVIEAVDKFNQKHGTTYAVSELQYIGSDTPSRTAYAELAEKILYAYASNQH